MNSPDIFDLQALMQALEQIHSTMDLAALPEKLFSAVGALIPGATLTLVQMFLIETRRLTETPLGRSCSTRRRPVHRDG